MKDLKSIYKSDSYKKELYTVKLPDDNVYEWRVALVCLFYIQSPLQLRDPFSSLFVILSTRTVELVLKSQYGTIYVSTNFLVKHLIEISNKGSKNGFLIEVITVS